MSLLPSAIVPLVVARFYEVFEDGMPQRIDRDIEGGTASGFAEILAQRQRRPDRRQRGCGPQRGLLVVENDTPARPNQHPHCTTAVSRQFDEVHAPSLLDTID